MPTLEAVKRFGALVREARREKKMTLREMSEELGERWSVQHLSNIETGNLPGVRKNGEYTLPDALVEGVGAVLEIPLSDLHAALGRMPDNELIPEPILDELRGAAHAGEFSEEAVGDIADYIRWKREQARQKKAP